MVKIVDVVNFNADASCLSSQSWLDILAGGKDSVFCKWLDLFIKYQKKVVLGFPGATVSDLVQFNQEAVSLINNNPDIFELVLRPFSHDAPLLRLKSGFEFNFDCGIAALKKEFHNIIDFYLSPEFMCTSTQLQMLIKQKIAAVFIHPGRFDQQINERIPMVPYSVKGIMGTSISCIPFNKDLTEDYLYAIHHFDCKSWNNRLSDTALDIIYSWRDGESCFLLPNSLSREEYWLKNESDFASRAFLKEVSIKAKEKEGKELDVYPIHSFSAWTKEMRMFWFIERVNELEKRIDSLSREQIFIWLLAINSDILSSVEKKGPEIKIRKSVDQKCIDYTILRQNKGFVGEEYLEILASIQSKDTQDYLKNSQEAHIRILRSRLDYMKTIR